MRKATICVGGILCLGLAAVGVHKYQSVTTAHAEAATTTVPRTVNATVTPVNETRHHLTKRTTPHALTDIAPETLSLIRKYLVAHDTPLYNVARDRLLTEIKAVERATGARLGKTCGVDGDDDDGDDDASPAGFGVGHASFKAAFPGAPRPGGGK